MIIVLIFEGRIKIGKMCIISTKNKTKLNKQTNVDAKEELEDSKGVIRTSKSKKDRQNNNPQKVQKYKQRSKIHTHTTKDQVTRTPLVTSFDLI